MKKGDGSWIHARFDHRRTLRHAEHDLQGHDPFLHAEQGVMRGHDLRRSGPSPTAGSGHILT